MEQDEEMDTTPLTQTEPLFFIDKEKEDDSRNERGDQCDDDDSGQEEEPYSWIKNENEPFEVSASMKALSKNRRMANGKRSQESESEESSEEEEMEDHQAVQAIKHVRISPPPQCLTLS